MSSSLSTATTDTKHGQSMLLDEDGAITTRLEACLRQIFTRFSSNGVVLTPTELDSWAIATNGTALSADEKEEMLEFLDMDDDGNLNFSGFVQIYQLQTENDEDETWRDLAKHGFDRSLGPSAAHTTIAQNAEA